MSRCFRTTSQGFIKQKTPSVILDTLAYKAMQDKSFILYGKGSDLTNAKAVKRRGKCKPITQTTILKLIDIAKEKGALDRVNSYWNTYHCQNRIITSNRRMYAPHCKNRFCTYCCGIRKAELAVKANRLPIIIIKEKEILFLGSVLLFIGADVGRSLVKNSRSP